MTNTVFSISKAGRIAVVAAAFLGWLCAGVQLGLMPLASLSVTRGLLGPAFDNALAGVWFARYTAALMLGAAIGGIWLGGLGDRIGRARAMACSILCYSVFGGAGFFVTNQDQLLALRFLAGLGIGGMWPNGVALVAEVWSDVSRPLLAGLIGTAANLGVLVMSQLGTFWKVTPESWRGLMLAGAAPALLGLAIWCFLPESPRWLATRGAEQAAADVPLRVLFRPPLRRRTLIGICLGAIPLIGAWGASKWLIPWADHIGGAALPGYKATTQAFWAGGAALGSFVGGHVANLLGRRLAYFLISLGSVVITCGLFVWMRPLEPWFLQVVFVQGFISTLFFGWLPLYLPELFPTRVRATGAGVSYNFGRFASAAGVLGAGALMTLFGGDYAKVGAITSLVYALGMIVICFAPDTTGKPLED